MRLRPVLILALTVGVVALGLLPSVIQCTANAYLPKLQDRLERSGVRLSVVDLSGHLRGISVDSLELWFSIPTSARGPKIPAVVQLQDVFVSLEGIFPPRLRLRSRAYSGSIDLTLRSPFGAPILEGTVRAVDLGTHPQLHALGLARAVTSLELHNVPLKPDPQATAQVDLSVSEGSFSLSPRLVELVGDEAQQVADLLKLDQLSDLQARVVGSMEAGSFMVRPMHLESSLGTMEGQARGTFDNGRGEPSLGGNLRVKLSDESSDLRGWLPLVSNNAVASDAPSFGVRFSSTTCSNQSSQTARIGGVCLKGSITP